ncbi:MAG TPA: hypothetical protein VM367_00795, partial [Pseudonocardia sp.]|nr:hypothetical protein [Pseudonocardia sp.]
RPPRPGAAPPAAPAPRPVGEDDLFGPLPAHGLGDFAATPIFEAVASAWFREPDAGGNGHAPGEGDWGSPGDVEWAAAAARAARPDPVDVTAAGLPRRDPGNQMITPSVRRGEPEQAADAVERAPERVRHRLAVYQQGLQRGRHRAAEPADQATPDASWWQLEG